MANVLNQFLMGSQAGMQAQDFREKQALRQQQAERATETYDINKALNNAQILKSAMDAIERVGDNPQLRYETALRMKPQLEKLGVTDIPFDQLTPEDLTGDKWEMNKQAIAGFIADPQKQLTAWEVMRAQQLKDLNSPDERVRKYAEIQTGMAPREVGSADLTLANLGRAGDVANVRSTIKGAESGASESAKLSAKLAVEPELNRQKAKESAIGKVQGEASVMLPETIAAADYSVSLIDKALSHPGLETATGASSKFDPRNITPGTDAYNFNTLMDQIQGRTFLQAFESLKGGGQITEVEGKKAEQSIARLKTAQSKEEFTSALKELQAIIINGKERALAKSGNKTKSKSAPSEPAGMSDEQKQLEELRAKLGDIGE